MDMSAATELAHRRLSDFIWRQSKAYKFNVPLLIHFTKCTADSWPEVWTGLQEKGWKVAGDYLVHSGVIEAHNSAQREYVAECNQTAPANARKTGVLRTYVCCTDKVTGIVTTNVTSVVTSHVAKSVTTDVTKPQSESKSESKPEPLKTSVISQTSQSTPKPNGTILTFSMLERVSREIIANAHGWHYDNHKLRPEDLAQGGLVGALKPYVNRITERQVHEAWQEGAVRLHKAVVDNLEIHDRAKYAVKCWKEQMENLAGNMNGNPVK